MATTQQIDEDTTRELVLSDGRTLAYSIYGDQSSSRVAFYFHGFPASRLEASLWDSAAASLSVRIIAPDRPGMGKSTLQPNRTILGWAKDVLELANHLEIKEFSIIALSGGSPYAFACAKEIPKSQLKNVTIVSGAYPLSYGTAGMMFSAKTLLFVASWLPWFVGTMMDWALGMAARDTDHPEIFDQRILKEMETRPEPDRRCLEDESFKNNFLASVREAFRSSAHGAAWEARLLGTVWGFELEDVCVDRTLLWHGKEDVNCPVAMAEKAEKSIPGARLLKFDGEAHISILVNYMGKIIEGAFT